MPACGPSRTSTLAPSRGLSAVSYTMPLMRSPPLGGGAAGLGVVAVGPTGPPSRLPSPQPAIPWASTRSTIPPNLLIDPSRGNENRSLLLTVKRESAAKP